MVPYLVIFKLTFEESFVMFEIAPSNLSKCELCYKKKNFQFGNLNMWKLLLYWKSTPSHLSESMFLSKRNKFKLETKNALFTIFLAWNLKKTFIILEISTFEFAKMQTVLRRERTLNLEPKMPFLFFLGWNWKNLSLYELRNLKFVKSLSFRQKRLWIWDQMYLIWIFVGWNLKKLLLFSTWAPSILLKMNFSIVQ